MVYVIVAVVLAGMAAVPVALLKARSEGPAVLLDIFAGIAGLVGALFVFLPACSIGCNHRCVERCGTWWGLPLPTRWLAQIVLVACVGGTAGGVLVRRWLAR